MLNAYVLWSIRKKKKKCPVQNVRDIYRKFKYQKLGEQVTFCQKKKCYRIVVLRYVQVLMESTKLFNT